MGDSFEILPEHQQMHQPELMIYHDEDDLFVPITDGEEIAKRWDGARFIRTQGLGHHRILRDPSIIESCIQFFQAAKPQTAAA